MGNAMYILETNDICKKYGQRYAVNKVNMHIEKGDIYGFVGENGAGKTTIIRLITGLAKPTSGSYSINGVDSNSKEIYNERKKLAAIVESVSIIGDCKPLDNLKYQRTITNTKKSDEELIALINKVGLNYEEVKDKKVGNFSLGMRQRLGIAIAMVSSPELIILDEPMNGLDPQGFIEIREIIHALSKEGVTFLISSHILSELEKVCNKVGFISKGELLKEVTMKEIHRNSRKRIDIFVKNPGELKDLLVKELGIKDFKVKEEKVKIFDDVDVNKVMKVLVDNNVNVNSFNVKQDTVEDYYINLLVRGEN